MNDWTFLSELRSAVRGRENTVVAGLAYDAWADYSPDKTVVVLESLESGNEICTMHFAERNQCWGLVYINRASGAKSHGAAILDIIKECIGY